MKVQQPISELIRTFRNVMNKQNFQCNYIFLFLGGSPSRLITLHKLVLALIS